MVAIAAFGSQQVGPEVGGLERQNSLRANETIEFHWLQAADLPAPAVEDIVHRVLEITDVSTSSHGDVVPGVRFDYRQHRLPLLVIQLDLTEPRHSIDEIPRIYQRFLIAAQQCRSGDIVQEAKQVA